MTASEALAAASGAGRWLARKHPARSWSELQREQPFELRRRCIDCDETGHMPGSTSCPLWARENQED